MSKSQHSLILIAKYNVVFVTAKVMNFEQITTRRPITSKIISCLCYRKGNEFWANHNHRLLLPKSLLVVFVTAKVMNFEQITTHACTGWLWFGCLCYRKGNEFWANHNINKYIRIALPVVFVTAKVMNFEQITTCGHRRSFCYRLSLLPQR